MGINTGQVHDRLVTNKDTIFVVIYIFSFLLQNVLKKWEKQYQIDEIILIHV